MNYKCTSSIWVLCEGGGSGAVVFGVHCGRDCSLQTQIHTPAVVLAGSSETEVHEFSPAILWGRPDAEGFA